MRSILMISLLVSTAACTTVAPGTETQANAKPLVCPSGYHKQGNRCVKDPTPPPPPKTQTCWDGSVIPATQNCPVKPPPPPTTQTCPDGSVIPVAQQCPLPVIPSAAVNDVSLSESAGTVPVHIILTNGNKQPSVVDYSISPGHGTLAEGKDFVAASGSLTFQPGETDKTINLTVMDNKVVEGDKQGVITLTANSNVQIGRSAIFTVLEDDVAPPPPSPPPPSSGVVTILNRAPTYGDVFQATKACVSADNPSDVLTVGDLYDVVAVGGYSQFNGPTNQTPDVSFVYLLTHPTDTRHFGDGAFSMHMMANCGVPVTVSP